MAFAPGVHNPPAFNVGIDVMRTQIPARDTVDSFIAVFEEQVCTRPGLANRIESQLTLYNLNSSLH